MMQKSTNANALRRLLVVASAPVVLAALQPGVMATAFAQAPASASVGGSPVVGDTVQSQDRRIWMSIGERRISVALADNAAANAFAAMLPMTLDMPDLNGNEKHVGLPKALPVDTTRPGTLRTGDLMLYGPRPWSCST
jgi:hypothetical protein